MAAPSNPTLRKLAGILLVLILICVFLSLYFLKYIPTQRINFHHSSFLELKQFQSALEERNEAYGKVIDNFIRYRDTSTTLKKNTIDLSSLAKQFTYVDYRNKKKSDYRDNGTPVYRLKNKDSFRLCKMSLEKNDLTNKWQIEYLVCDQNDTAVAGFRKSIDSLVSGLVTSYRDIFDEYLIIRDSHLHDKDNFPSKKKTHQIADSSDHLHDGEIIFNSGNLSVDYLVNTDSLLKKNDGFSLLNIHDVVIEGNAYKLFLYPVKLGGERIILAGLISLERYNAQFKKIPFNLIALVAVLVLLVLINLPVLKVYMLGAYEQINGTDIRLLIGTYFVTAFIAFFLFSNSFLAQTEKKKTHAELKSFGENIKNNFLAEIDSMCTQVETLDNGFCDQLKKDKGELLKEMIDYNSQDTSSAPAPGKIDTLFKPSTYPFLNNVFWIDRNGRWVTSWGFKKRFDRVPRLKVDDRQYYQDFKYKRYLKLPGDPHFDREYTIQPTLSKLDGEYTITVLIKSRADSQEISIPHCSRKELAPAYVGLGSDMNFVTNAIPAPGYNFCIINEDGDVLYDSKPGRALLSNIFRVVDRPSDLSQCARYRSEKYFNSIMLRGRQVSMISIPLKGFPYTLLAYYKVADTEDIHVHLIAVSAIIVAAILLLLLVTGLINELTMKKRTVLQSPARLHFEWLYPDSTKRRFFRQLPLWMCLIFVCFLSWWGFIESYCDTQCEFSLIFVSILFPFAIAIQYFFLRQKDYYNRGTLTEEKTRPELPSSWLLSFLGIIVVIINAYAFNSGYSWQILIPELFFSVIICLSVISLKKQAGSAETDNSKNTAPVGSFTIAILFGVFLISIVPAACVFCLLLKQETNLQSAYSQIEMTRQINSRRIQLNQRIMDDNSFTKGDGTVNRRAIRDLKFLYGIYTLDTNVVSYDQEIASDSVIVQIVSPGYLRLHNYFFPESGISDSTASAASDGADSTWYFFVDRRFNKNTSQFIYQNEQDGDNKAIVGQVESAYFFQTATSLLFHEMSTAGSLYIIMFVACVLIFVITSLFVTKSLVKRVFLLDFSYLKPDKEVLTDDFEDHAESVEAEEMILAERDQNSGHYASIWIELKSREKFTLYDFARDGFTNYKNSDAVYQLIKKGLLYFRNGRLRMLSIPFREFVLTNHKDKAITKMEARAKKEDSSRNVMIPLLIILTMLGLFIFFTQDLIYQKLTGLLTSVGTIIPLMANFFHKKETDHADEKENGFVENED